jgi:hypothetical protein
MTEEFPDWSALNNSLKIPSIDSRFKISLQILVILGLLKFILSLAQTQNNKEEKEMEKFAANQPTEDTCQTHTHEFEGSTKLAEEAEDRHNHRFAGVTTQMIPFPDGHRHVVFTNTDFFENHHHEIGQLSGPPIPVDNGKHVHFFTGNSTIDDGHFHEFQFTTLIDNPLI